MTWPRARGLVQHGGCDISVRPQELNDLNFARFDAKLEQRLAQLETRLTKRLFGFWIAQAATTAGLVFGVVKLLA